MTDKYETLMKGLSIDSLLLFVKAFKSQLFAEGLVQGNFTSSVSASLIPALFASWSYSVYFSKIYLCDIYT